MTLTFDLVGNINDELFHELHNAIVSQKEAIDHLHLNISSLGGSVSSAVTIYNYLKKQNFLVTTHNLGETSSAAVLIYLAGKKRTAEKISKFIMHPIKYNTNASLSYFQIEELLHTIDADIKNYGNIVNQETNYLNSIYDVDKCLRESSIVLDYDSAYKCGIIASLSN